MQNKHHIWWMRKSYRTGLERKFRNLPCNVVKLDVEIHNLLHRYSRPPDKPPVQDMADAIQRHRGGECRCESN